MHFPQSVIDEIGSYVYLLRDPRNKEVFYLGKGCANRIFQHSADSLEIELISDKLDRIRAVQSEGLEVEHLIMRHGLTDEESFEVEGALIDFVGLHGLTNLVHGHDGDERGMMSASEVSAKYSAPSANIVERVILITVNKAFRRGIGAEELYEFTRGKWVIGERRNKAKYAFAVYRGIIRQVYLIQKWNRSETLDSEVRLKWIEQQDVKVRVGNRVRWEFDGRVASELQHYVGCSTVNYQVKGAQNPIKYVNC